MSLASKYGRCFERSPALNPRASRAVLISMPVEHSGTLLRRANLLLALLELLLLEAVDNLVAVEQEGTPQVRGLQRVVRMKPAR